MYKNVVLRNEALKQLSFSKIPSDALPHNWSLSTVDMVYFGAFPKLEKVVYKLKPSSGKFLPPRATSKYTR
jgi:hypothetical protein